MTLDGFPTGAPGLSLACQDGADSTFSAYRVFSFARDCGLPAAAAWEAATAAAQLTTTLVRCAGSGRLLVRWLEAPRAGLELVASHETPAGAAPGTLATTPLGGGPGLVNGLGSVRRLLSEVTIHASSEGITRVVGHKWAGPAGP